MIKNDIAHTAKKAAEAANQGMQTLAVKGRWAGKRIRERSRQAAELSQEISKDAARYVSEHPFKSVGVAVAAIALIALGSQAGKRKAAESSDILP